MPLSITAESGTATTFAAVAAVAVVPPAPNSTDAYIAGLSSPPGLASSMRTGTVRVSPFNVG